jgi:hypothetical protein
MKFSIQVLMLFFLMSACSGSKKKQASEEVLTTSDDFQSIPIDLNVGEVPFSEVIEQIEILGLEETTESLISAFDKIDLSGSQLIFVDWQSKDIFIYSREGNFINKFNHEGDGPGEYKAIQSLWVEGGEIFIFDNIRRQLLTYDFDGKHLSTTQINTDGADLIPTQDGFLLDMVNRPTDDSLNFNVVVYDKKLKRTGLLNPFRGPLKFRIEPSGTLRPYKKGVIYTPVLNDSAFLIQNGESKPLVKFDFGAQWLWNDGELEGQNAFDAIRTSDKVWQFTAKIGEDHAHLAYSVGLEINGVLLISRASANYQKIKMAKNAEERFSIYPIQWENDRLLFSVASYDIPDLLEKLEDNQWKLSGDITLKEIESSENPVLMWVKFNNF